MAIKNLRYGFFSWCELRILTGMKSASFRVNNVYGIIVATTADFLKRSGASRPLLQMKSEYILMGAIASPHRFLGQRKGSGKNRLQSKREWTTIQPIGRFTILRVDRRPLLSSKESGLYLFKGNPLQRKSSSKEILCTKNFELLGLCFCSG